MKDYEGGKQDALHNAAMILTGMGPVSIRKTVPSKLFSAIYALFSGIAFLGTVRILLIPSTTGCFISFIWSN